MLIINDIDIGYCKGIQLAHHLCMPALFIFYFKLCTYQVVDISVFCIKGTHKKCIENGVHDNALNNVQLHQNSSRSMGTENKFSVYNRSANNFIFNDSL